MTDPLDSIELRKGMADLAELLRHYYLELVRQGFSKREAMHMLLAYQRDIVGGQGGTQ